MRGWQYVVLLTTMILPLRASSALAVDGLSVSAKHIRSGPGEIGTSVVFELRNETDKSFRFLQITCTGFGSNHVPIEVGSDWLKNLTSHETAYGEVRFSSDETRDIKSASCRVDIAEIQDAPSLNLGDGRLPAQQQAPAGETMPKSH
jgi:hypothetical protein